MSHTARPDLKGIAPEALRAAVAAAGLPRYRADQLLDWMYRKRTDDVDAMTNIGKRDAATLRETFGCTHLEVQARQDAADGTVKVLWTLPDGERVESVWLVSGERRTICLSTQVGCAFSCTFCASGEGPLVRNLTTAEIVDQVLGFERLLEQRPTNIVYMGMGEPLTNYEAVRDSIAIFSHPDAYGLSPRRITVSTVGYLPGIERAIADKLPVKLALSVHATTDPQRADLIPGAERYPLDALLEALLRFRKATKRPVTLEYVLLEGENDREIDAQRLAKFAKRIGAKVNLIVYNPVAGWRFHSPPPEAVDAFRDAIRAKGAFVFVRHSGGREIAGACGQLRKSDALHL